MYENLEQIELRKAELNELMVKPEANLDEIENEINTLEARANELLEERRKALEDVANDIIEGTEIIEERKENKTMNLVEVRNSVEYAKAYANYVLNEDDKELRSLLSENVSGGKFPVPTMLENKIAHAWESAKLFDGVQASSIKGNVKIGFEISADGAVIHTEGGDAVAQEVITMGVEEFKPQSIKKFVTISDEVYDLNGDMVLEYLYNEMAAKIVKKAQETLVADIVARPATSSATRMGVKAHTLSGEITKQDIILAKALLSDEASDDLVFIANKSQIATIKTATTADGYPIADVFDGCDPVAENTLKTYAAASSGNVVGIILDRKAILDNKPNGDELTFKFDENSLAEQDLIKVVGRQFVALGIKAPYTAVVLKK